VDQKQLTAKTSGGIVMPFGIKVLSKEEIEAIRHTITPIEKIADKAKSQVSIISAERAPNPPSRRKESVNQL
jgi:hypothetical protein